MVASLPALPSCSRNFTPERQTPAVVLVPPVEDPTLWVEKAFVAIRVGVWSFNTLLLLVSADVQAPWFNGYVRGHAIELPVGRLTLKGREEPPPNDFILAVYGDREHKRREYEWNWKAKVRKA